MADPGFGSAYRLEIFRDMASVTLRVTRPLAHPTHPITLGGSTTTFIFGTGTSTGTTPMGQHGSNRGVRELLSLGVVMAVCWVRAATGTVSIFELNHLHPIASRLFLSFLGADDDPRPPRSPGSVPPPRPHALPSCRSLRGQAPPPAPTPPSRPSPRRPAHPLWRAVRNCRRTRMWCGP